MDKCGWCKSNPLLEQYHDEEWGIPVHNDTKQFEFLMMEVMQCGLNWNMMLAKREIFRRCFNNYDVNLVARYGEEDINRILSTEGMIKSRRKIEAIIHNANCFLKIIEECGSFDSYLWSFTANRTLIYKDHQRGHMVTRNALSDAISADLKRRGFKYLGSITLYSHLQACGMINDHEPTCFCYKKIIQMNKIKYATDTLLFHQ